MTGTVARMEKNDNRRSERGSIATYEFEWTSTAGGAVSESLGNLNGILHAIETDPDGTDVPTNLYDITITDSYGHDVLEGAGADRSSTAVEKAYPAVGTYFQPVVCGEHTLVVASAGAAKKGVIRIFLR